MLAFVGVRQAHARDRVVFGGSQLQRSAARRLSARQAQQRLAESAAVTPIASLPDSPSSSDLDDDLSALCVAESLPIFFEKKKNKRYFFLKKFAHTHWALRSAADTAELVRNVSELRDDKAALEAANASLRADNAALRRAAAGESSLAARESELADVLHEAERQLAAADEQQRAAVAAADARTARAEAALADERAARALDHRFEEEQAKLIDSLQQRVKELQAAVALAQSEAARAAERAARLQAELRLQHAREQRLPQATPVAPKTHSRALASSETDDLTTDDLLMGASAAHGAPVARTPLAAASGNSASMVIAGAERGDVTSKMSQSAINRRKSMLRLPQPTPVRFGRSRSRCVAPSTLSHHSRSLTQKHRRDVAN